MKILSLFFLMILAACHTVPVPDGYRMNRYKAPIPDHVPGAQTLSITQAVHLKQRGAVFIDVIGSGKFLTKSRKGGWISVKPHTSIPGSYWLPDVGRGALTSDQNTYFEDALVQLSVQDKQTELVFFCLKSCWMSWNGAKRAASLGYKSVYWLPDGKDGWQEAGYWLEEITPFSIEK